MELKELVLPRCAKGLGAGKQVEYMTRICNQRLYLLNQTRKQGLSQAQLHNVFQAFSMSSIQYASPACNRYVSEAYIRSIQ